MLRISRGRQDGLTPPGTDCQPWRKRIFMGALGRHARFIAFGNAWKAAHPGANSERPTAAEIDNRRNAERLAPDRSTRTFTAALDGLPDGTFVTWCGVPLFQLAPRSWRRKTASTMYSSSGSRSSR